jgi:hypothetical protein
VKVLPGINVNIAVFWDVITWRLIERKRFGGTCCLFLQGRIFAWEYGGTNIGKEERETGSPVSPLKPFNSLPLRPNICGPFF